MATTLIQLRRLTRARLGVSITDDFFPDDVLDDGINMAIETIDAEARWPWNTMVEIVTIGPANADVPVPLNWRATRSVFFAEKELILVSPVDMLTWSTVIADIPNVWAPMPDGVIGVRPIPSTDIELRHLYYRQSAWLRNDEDEPFIPTQYAPAIVAKAAELLAARESSGGDTTRHGAEYVTWINRMRRDVRSSTGPTRTRVRPGSWI